MYIYYLHGTVFIYSRIYNIALYLYIMYTRVNLFVSRVFIWKGVHNY